MFVLDRDSISMTTLRIIKWQHHKSQDRKCRLGDWWTD